MKKNTAYSLTIFLSFFLFVIFFSFALDVQGQTPTGRITRIRFFLFESSLEPETAEALKKQVVSPDSTFALKAFFNGKMEATSPPDIVVELKDKFALSYLELKKQGTLILIWGEKKELKNKKTREEFSLPATSRQIGFFYDGSAIFSHPAITFLELKGEEHWLLIRARDPSAPPGEELVVALYKSKFPRKKILSSEEEPEPSRVEFSDLIKLHEKDAYLIALMGPQDTAYFLYFIAENVLKEHDVESLLPRLIYKVDPLYPEEAMFRRIQGKVELVVRTDADGRVYEVQVIESSHPLLTEAASQAVRQWVYKVPVLDGKRVPMVFTVTVTFRLSR